MRGKLVLALTLPALAWACSGDDVNEGPDATADATTDSSGNDSTRDSTVDSATDSGNDSGSDGGGGDAPLDSPGDTGGDDASDASDAQVDAGADTGADAGLDDAGCGVKTPYATDGGTCTVGVEYTCGANVYEIQCGCSPALCECKKNDAGAMGLINYAGCPSCTVAPSYSSMATFCGIPY